MKKSIIFLLFLLVGLLLFGCTDNQQESVSENDNIEQNDETEEDNKSTRPPEISLDGGNINIPTSRYSYCWDESNCSINPRDPEEEVTYDRSFRVNSGNTLTFSTHVTAAYVGSPISPDIIEVTQFHKGNESKVEVTNKQLTAPEEEGTYFFNVHAKWEEEIKGEAYYALKLIVKEKD